MNAKETDEPLFGPETLTYCYTRKMALEDGILVDITKLAKDAGFKFPVAVTSTVYDGFLTPPESIFKSSGQSVEGRTWDLLMMFLLTAKGRSESTVFFNVSFLMPEGQKLQKLKAVIGPGDSGEPVITIMLPNED